LPKIAGTDWLRRRIPDRRKNDLAFVTAVYLMLAMPAAVSTVLLSMSDRAIAYSFPVERF